MSNNIGNCNKYAIDYNVLIVTLLCALYHGNKLPTAVIVIAYQKFVKWHVFVNHAFTTLRFGITQHMDLRYRSSKLLWFTTSLAGQLGGG